MQTIKELSDLPEKEVIRPSVQTDPICIQRKGIQRYNKQSEEASLAKLP
jgi:hypothetical protein